MMLPRPSRGDRKADSDDDNADDNAASLFVLDGSWGKQAPWKRWIYGDTRVTLVETKSAEQQNAEDRHQPLDADEGQNGLGWGCRKLRW